MPSVFLTRVRFRISISIAFMKQLLFKKQFPKFSMSLLVYYNIISDRFFDQSEHAYLSYFVNWSSLLGKALMSGP